MAFQHLCNCVCISITGH